MSNKHDATVEEFIFRSLGHVEQGRLQSFEIRYYIGNKVIEISVRAWEKYDPKKANEDY